MEFTRQRSKHAGIADSKDTAQRCKYLDRVLGSKEFGWNRHRAIVNKATLAVRLGDLQKLSDRDRLDLADAYSYCHSQRLGMFDRCHEALWSILEREGKRESSYRLFRHSSFIWRIRGEDATELRYFERLKALDDKSEGKTPPGILIEVRYFSKRATVLLARLMGSAKASSSSTSK
jgi:hypothetical protein